jgi:putative inorganic carbon (HCO3(-)) transporter
MGELRGKLKGIATREYTREEIINVILYMTISLVPLIITNTTWVYINGKLGALYIVGVIGVILGARYMMKPFYLEKKIALIFLLTILIVSILSPVSKIAFIGSDARGEGFIILAIYVILFLLATKYLKINNLGINIIFISASIISIYGIFQFYGIDPIQQFIFGSIQSGYGAISTIGNRNFLSNYICIFLFVSSSMYIFKKEKKYFFFAIIQFAGLLCAMTRSGWLAFLVFSLIGLIFIIKRKDCLKRALIIFITFTMIFAVLNITSNSAILGRTDKQIIISEEGELQDSIADRSLILRISWNAFIDSPFKGYGPDTLRTRIIEDYPEESLEYMLNRSSYIDKAHNEYLEYAVSCGIFTLISYLVLIGFIIKGLIKGIGNDLNKVLLLTLIGYLVQAFFNISTVAVAPLYWIFLGYCVNTIYGKNLNNTKTVI